MLSKVDEPRKEPHDNYNSEMCLAIVAVTENNIPQSTDRERRSSAAAMSNLTVGFLYLTRVLKQLEEWKHF